MSVDETIVESPEKLSPSEPIGSNSENKDETIKQKEKLGIKSYVKVDTDRLDQLIDAIGEMVIYSSMLIQNAHNLLGHNEVIIKTIHQVEKFSRDLQEIAMSMRLDPIKGLFQKKSRLV
ncbi:MAG: hypothetical protein IT292_12085 [Deltaproteobacteria bacterium]|nr:hypothetical protein [Deltaproteobacteria bacterium]